MSKRNTKTGKLSYDMREELEDINVADWRELSALITTTQKDISNLRSKKTDPNERTLLLLLRRLLGKVMTEKLYLMEERGPQ